MTPSQTAMLTASWVYDMSRTSRAAPTVRSSRPYIATRPTVTAAPMACTAMSPPSARSGCTPSLKSNATTGTKPTSPAIAMVLHEQRGHAHGEIRPRGHRPVAEDGVIVGRNDRQSFADQQRREDHEGDDRAEERRTEQQIRAGQDRDRRREA